MTDDTKLLGNNEADMLAICDKHEIGYDELEMIQYMVKTGDINKINSDPFFTMSKKLLGILNDLESLGYISKKKVEK